MAHKKPVASKKVVHYHEELIKHVRDVLVDTWVNSDLRVQDLADEADLSYATVNNFLHWRTQRPQIQTLLQLADALDLRIAILPKDAPVQTDEIRLDQGRGQRRRG